MSETIQLLPPQIITGDVDIHPQNDPILPSVESIDLSPKKAGQLFGELNSAVGEILFSNGKAVKHFDRSPITPAIREELKTAARDIITTIDTNTYLEPDSVTDPVVAFENAANTALVYHGLQQAIDQHNSDKSKGWRKGGLTRADQEVNTLKQLQKRMASSGALEVAQHHFENYQQLIPQLYRELDEQIHLDPRVMNTLVFAAVLAQVVGVPLSGMMDGSQSDSLEGNGQFAWGTRSHETSPSAKAISTPNSSLTMDRELAYTKSFGTTLNQDNPEPQPTVIAMESSSEADQDGRLQAPVITVEGNNHIFSVRSDRKLGDEYWVGTFSSKFPHDTQIEILEMMIGDFTGGTDIWYRIKQYGNQNPEEAEGLWVHKSVFPLPEREADIAAYMAANLVPDLPENLFEPENIEPVGASIVVDENVGGGFPVPSGEYPEIVESAINARWASIVQSYLEKLSLPAESNYSLISSESGFTLLQVSMDENGRQQVMIPLGPNGQIASNFANPEIGSTLGTYTVPEGFKFGVSFDESNRSTLVVLGPNNMELAYLDRVSGELRPHPRRPEPQVLDVEAIRLLLIGEASLGDYITTPQTLPFEGANLSTNDLGEYVVFDPEYSIYQPRYKFDVATHKWEDLSIFRDERMTLIVPGGRVQAEMQVTQRIYDEAGNELLTLAFPTEMDQRQRDGEMYGIELLSSVEQVQSMREVTWWNEYRGLIESGMLSRDGRSYAEVLGVSTNASVAEIMEVLAQTRNHWPEAPYLWNEEGYEDAWMDPNQPIRFHVMPRQYAMAQKIVNNRETVDDWVYQALPELVSGMYLNSEGQLVYANYVNSNDQRQWQGNLLLLGRGVYDHVVKGRMTGPREIETLTWQLDILVALGSEMDNQGMIHGDPIFEIQDKPLETKEEVD